MSFVRSTHIQLSHAALMSGCICANPTHIITLGPHLKATTPSLSFSKSSSDSRRSKRPPTDGHGVVASLARCTPLRYSQSIGRHSSYTMHNAAGCERSAKALLWEIYPA